MRKQSSRSSIILAVMLLAVCGGMGGGASLSFAAKRHLAVWQKFEQSIRRYREQIDSLKQKSTYIIAEADRAIKQAVKVKNYDWAQTLTRQAIEKLDAILREITHLTVPDNLTQFHRKRIEFHLYQRMFYEAFLRGDPALELTNRRMCLVVELQSLQELRRLYDEFYMPQAFIDSLDSSIAMVEDEIARFNNPKELKKFDFPLAFIEEK